MTGMKDKKERSRRVAINLQIDLFPLLRLFELFTPCLLVLIAAKSHLG